MRGCRKFKLLHRVDISTLGESRVTAARYRNDRKSCPEKRPDFRQGGAARSSIFRNFWAIEDHDNRETVVYLAMMSVWRSASERARSHLVTVASRADQIES